MKTSIKMALLSVAFLLVSTAVFGQQKEWADKYNNSIVFNHHWFLQAQGGASYTVGEAKFGKLISPAAAVYAGYQFTPLWGLRFGVSGWQAKGAWVSPRTIYKYNELQGNVDVTLDLSNWWGGYRWNRFFDAYFFLGVGLNGGFNNKKAGELVDAGYNLEYYWDKNHVGCVGRAGLGANLRLSDHVAITVELGGNMLSDKYNSKKAGNLDWQTNLMLGLNFRLGKTHRSRPAPAPVIEAPAPAPDPALPPMPPSDNDCPHCKRF